MPSPETPTGTIDGVNAVFTASAAIAAGELIYVDRLKQVAGTDYTISGDTITFLAGSIPQPNADGSAPPFELYYVADIAAGALLCSVADVKSWMQLQTSNTQGDAELTRLCLAVSRWVKTYTDRTFTGAEAVSEKRHGPGGTELYLSSGPVVAITSLTVDAVAISAQAADGEPGYFLNGNLLCLVGYAFTRGRNNVRVTYTAGYTSVPADVAQAAIEIVASAYRRGKRGPDVTSETVASGQTFTFSTASIPKSAREILDQYRKVVPA